MSGPQTPIGIYLVEYQLAGNTYLETMWATDWPDAEARLRAIRLTGTVIGSNVTSIPVNAVTLAPVGLALRAAALVRNLLKGFR